MLRRKVGEIIHIYIYFNNERNAEIRSAWQRPGVTYATVCGFLNIGPRYFQQRGVTWEMYNQWDTTTNHQYIWFVAIHIHIFNQYRQILHLQYFDNSMAPIMVNIEVVVPYYPILSRYWSYIKHIGRCPANLSICHQYFTYIVC